MAYKQVQNEYGAWVLMPEEEKTSSPQIDWSNYDIPSLTGGYTPQTAYTPQSYTGQVGGTTYAAQPALSKYEPSPTQQFDLSKTIGDWVGGISKAWESLISPKPVSQAPQQGIKPFWEAQPVGAGEMPWEKPKVTEISAAQAASKPELKWGQKGTWGEKGVYAVQPELYTPETAQEEMGTDFQGTLSNIQRQEQFGYLPTGSSQKMAMDAILAKNSPVSDADASTFIQKSAASVNNEKDIMSVVTASNQRGITPPQISPEKLDMINNPTYIRALWDYGYKPPKVISGAISEINTTNQSHNGRITIDTSKLAQLEYDSLVNLLGQLSQFTPQEWKEIEDKNVNIVLKTTYQESDAFGNPVYSGKWDFQTPYKTKAEQEAEQEAETEAEKEKKKAEYWSPESVAERKRRRDEDRLWSEAEQMEGWSEFYKILGGLKMSPNMDEYFDNPTMFNELRRQWIAGGKAQSWEQFLANYDFKKIWENLTPSQRGERPAVFSPRMRSTS